MRNRRLLLIVLFVIGIALLGASIALQHGSSSNKANVTINFSAPDTNTLVVTLNNKPFTINNMQDTYHLAPGNYTLKATKTGYKDFSTSFSAAANDTIVINAKLELASNPAITNSSQVTIPGPTVTGFTVTNTHYFYDKTWAVITIQSPDGNSGIVVSKYDPSASKWTTELGPGTQFDSFSIKLLPSQVQDYLTSTGYVVSTGGQ